jgi:hypothetical protein
MGGEAEPAVPESRPSDSLVRSVHRAVVCPGGRVWSVWAQPGYGEQLHMGVWSVSGSSGCGEQLHGSGLDDDGVDLDELADEAEHGHAQQRRRWHVHLEARGDFTPGSDQVLVGTDDVHREPMNVVA